MGETTDNHGQRPCEACYQHVCLGRGVDLRSACRVSVGQHPVGRGMEALRHDGSLAAGCEPAGERRSAIPAFTARSTLETHGFSAGHPAGPGSEIPAGPRDADGDGDVDFLYLAVQRLSEDGEWHLVTAADGLPGAEFNADCLPGTGSTRTAVTGWFVSCPMPTAWGSRRSAPRCGLS